MSETSNRLREYAPGRVIAPLLLDAAKEIESLESRLDASEERVRLRTEDKIALQIELDTARSRLSTYEKWFSDHAAVLASHNIGGFTMSPYGVAVSGAAFPETGVERQKP